MTCVLTGIACTFADRLTGGTGIAGAAASTTPQAVALS